MTVVVRETKETTIRCELTRGTGRATVSTGQPFLDHMLVAFARYSGLDVAIQATGDLPLPGSHVRVVASAATANAAARMAKAVLICDKTSETFVCLQKRACLAERELPHAKPAAR